MVRAYRDVGFGIGLITTLLASTGTASAQDVDAETIEKLQQIIAEQQRQLEEQAAVLKDLQEQVDTIRQSANQARQTAARATVAANTPRAPVSDQENVVTSDNERVKLSISGQINRAINFADDGDSTKAYFVDNDASNSRLRFLGTGTATDDLTLGTQIEVAIAPNESSDVNQDNEDTGDFFDQRKVEIWLDSNRFGRATLGKGSAASDGTADVDLSGLDVIMFSSISDIVGGLNFREKDTDAPTAFTVSDAFRNFDGGRQDRIRYDSPAFGGFSFAASAGSDQRYDGVVRWAGAGYGFETAAGRGDRRSQQGQCQLPGRRLGLGPALGNRSQPHRLRRRRGHGRPG